MCVVTLAAQALPDWLAAGWAGPGAVKTAAQLGYHCLLRPAYLGAIFGGEWPKFAAQAWWWWPQEGAGPGAVAAFPNLCSTQ